MASVLNNLHLIASGKFDLIKRRSGCTDKEISDIFKTIKSFNPKPGLKFEGHITPIREPDLSVRRTEDGWLVELNNSTLPEIKVEKNVFFFTFDRNVRSESGILVGITLLRRNKKEISFKNLMYLSRVAAVICRIVSMN